ncbi:MAG: DUF4347 domain-containing protein [Methylovulum sp.]|nr:DUF4347 domain-containing protein [Methylovulum sp.]
MSSASNHKQLIIIDSQVNDWQSLAAGISATATILVLDSTGDGLMQIAEAMTAYSELDAIHIISHGSAGSLLLGSSVLNSKVLASYSKELKQIGSSLSATGDILLYGCNVAQSDIGLSFINQLAAMTGADVTASDDLTGKGGDWALEVSTGKIEASSAIDPPINYQNTLFASGETFAQGGGVVITDFGGSDVARSVVVQSDGQIIVAGSSDGKFAIARYNADGSLDKSFDSDGKVTTTIPSNAEGHDVVLDAKGNILVAGKSFANSSHNFTITRYLSNGDLDSSFNNNGTIVTTDFGPDDSANSIAIQSNGKILVAGYSRLPPNSSSYYGFSLVRYNIDGSLDNSFSGDGKVTLGGDAVSAYSVIVQTDDKILVAGEGLLNGVNSFALARYDSNGNLDTNFGGGDGIVSTVINQNYNYAYSVALQTDNKILVAGYGSSGSSNGGTGSDYILVRYDSNGNLDNSFSGDGKVTTDFGSPNDYANSLVVQKDGKIIVAGSSNGNFALARYDINGNLDNSFDGDGKVTTAINAYGDMYRSIALDADGKILVTGPSGTGDFVLLRYNIDGSLDTGTTTSGGLTPQQLLVLNNLKSSYNDSISHITYDEAANTGSYIGMPSSLYGECVSYVKSARIDLRGGSVNKDITWNHATGGPQTFTSLGFHVDTAIPMIGSAFVITAGYAGADATYGHTGIVRDVSVQRVFTRGVLQYEYKLELRDSNLTGHHEMTSYSKTLNFPQHGNGWQFIWGTNAEYDQDKAAIQNIIGQLYDNQLLDSSVAKQAYIDDAKLINRFFLLNTQEKFANFLNLIELYKAELGTAISLVDLSGSNLTNDVLAGVKIGTSADETLTGDSGINVLIGGAGNDTLTGGLANGTEADTFKFVSMHGGTDSITDFLSGIDKIEVIAENFGLKADTAVTLRSGTSLPAFSGTTAQFTYNTSNGELWFDRDGTGSSYEAFHIATLTGSKTLTSSDIRVVLGKVYTGDMGGGTSVNTIMDTTGLNQLTGSEQNDALFGLDGNDLLIGLGGNDILDGGAGIDTLNGGDGDDLYIVESSSDVVFEAFSDTLAGIDTVQSSKTHTLSTNVENLTLTGTDIINGTGNNLDNLLKGNEAANVLNGGLGVDTMDGGDGNDVYIVDNVSDVAAEQYGDAIAGIDTVKASVNFALSSNIENLTLTGTAAINGTGNAKANILTGNAKANTLNGAGGTDKLYGDASNDTLKGGSENDILIGGAGKDQLTGGTGADKFKFNAISETGSSATNRDTITDFNHNQHDKIDLSSIDANLTVTGNNTFASLTVGDASFGGNNPGILHFDSATHILYGNNDNDSAADFSILLSGVTTLSATDFVL